MAQLVLALGDRPVVLLHGARQTGKSTLVQTLGSDSAQYRTLDDAQTLAAATLDPRGFLDSSGGTLIIDEVQRAPNLLPAIKLAVDQDRRPGRFLLTGSAQVLVLPQVSESLAGRIEVLTLWPLAQEEIEGRDTGFIDRLFEPKLDLGHVDGEGREAILRRALTGGYPEVVTRMAPERRGTWFDSYLSTMLQREVRGLADIEALTSMPRVLGLLAARSGGLLNVADLARQTGIPNTSLHRYLALLQLVFLIDLVPPWSGSLSRRLVKSPKVYLTDAGLLGHLLRLTETQTTGRAHLVGQALENFVMMELRRQIGWSQLRPDLLHFRTHDGHEVDAILEARGGEIVGLEIKSSEVTGAEDFRGLRALAAKMPDRFLRGLVLHPGQHVLPFGPDLWAVPISALWS